MKHLKNLFISQTEPYRMLVFVKTIEGVANSYEVDPSDTIGHLKDLIQAKLGIDHSEQRLIFAGTN